MFDDTTRMPAADAAEETLGTLKLAKELPKNPDTASPKKTDADAASRFYAALDKAFDEAFSNLYITGDNEVIKLAQEATRACLTELLNGNNALRLSPEKMLSIQQDIQKLTTDIAHEAVALTQNRMAQPSTGTSKRPHNMREQIAADIRALKPVQDFKFKHLGFAAAVDAQRLEELALKHPKPMQ